MDGLLDITENQEDRCRYSLAIFVQCIREDRHPGKHHFILPESSFELTKKAKKNEQGS